MEEELKEIEYNGIKYLYRVEQYSCGEYGSCDCYRTIIYSSEYRTKKVRKYWLFGEYIDKKIYDKLFTLKFDVENSKYSKEEVKEAFDKKYQLWLKNLNREKEIESGNIL